MTSARLLAEQEPDQVVAAIGAEEGLRPRRLRDGASLWLPFAVPRTSDHLCIVASDRRKAGNRRGLLELSVERAVTRDMPGA